MVGSMPQFHKFNGKPNNKRAIYRNQKSLKAEDIISLENA